MTLGARGKVLAIVGPTGVGKTKLSVQLAKQIDAINVGAEVISTDSMQLYRNFDIGTAKVLPCEQSGVPHHMLDVLEPTRRNFDVTEYRRMALPLIETIHGRGQLPILVGGTNYYTEALLIQSNLVGGDSNSRVDEPFESSDEETLKATAKSGRCEAAYRKLREVDPDMAGRLHPRNLRKILRSLEIYKSTGQRHSDILKKQERKTRFNFHIICLTCAPEVHKARLDERIHQMLKDGLLEEVQALRKMYTNANIPLTEEAGSAGLLQSIGYKEFGKFFDSKGIDTEQQSPLYERYADDPLLQECVEKLKTNTQGYAKKQISWIRNRFQKAKLPVTMLDTTDLNLWNDRVFSIAMGVAQELLASEVTGGGLTLPNTLLMDNNNRSRHCEVCQRVFTGDQWDSHMTSRSHRKRVNGLRKFEQNMKRREESLKKKMKRSNPTDDNNDEK